jgi:hypothetical protein
MHSLRFAQEVVGVEVSWWGSSQLRKIDAHVIPRRLWSGRLRPGSSFGSGVVARWAQVVGKRG